MHYKRPPIIAEPISTIPDVLVHEHRSRQRLSEAMGTLRYRPFFDRPSSVRSDAHLISPGREELEGEEGLARLDGLVHFVDDLHVGRWSW